MAVQVPDVGIEAEHPDEHVALPRQVGARVDSGATRGMARAHVLRGVIMPAWVSQR